LGISGEVTGGLDAEPSASKAGGESFDADGFREVIKKTVARESEGLPEVGEARDHNDGYFGMTARDSVEEIVGTTVGEVIVEQQDFEGL
jgi:hypothetical protein